MAFKYLIRALRIDQLNRLRYGSGAPRYAERVWISPGRCKRYIEASDLANHFGSRVRQLSGRVVDEWPAWLERPFSCHPKLNYCWAHWCEGKDWQASGAIDFMLDRIAVSPTGVTDQCRDRRDVEQRFETLDSIWEEVQKAGRLPTRQELVPGNFREVGGILMHLGPGGEPIFSGAGCHRFAMALLLGGPFPAQLGCVHTSAIPLLPEFRVEACSGNVFAS